MNVNHNTKHIGIIACSAEGAALCYRVICAEGSKLLEQHEHPEISLHNHSLADYVDCIDRSDWKGVGDIMLSSAEKLTKAGADFLICPDNTIHQALDYVEPRSSLPWLHIAKVVATRAKELGYQRLGLTGTQWLVDSNVYPKQLEALGVEYCRPEENDRNEIGRIIMHELVKGVFNPEAVVYFQQVIERLKKRNCDAVVLGCTEIPLIINESNSPLPVLDSTRLLAQAALKQAIKAL